MAKMTKQPEGKEELLLDLIHRSKDTGKAIDTAIQVILDSLMQPQSFGESCLDSQKAQDEIA